MESGGIQLMKNTLQGGWGKSPIKAALFAIVCGSKFSPIAQQRVRFTARIDSF